jgi:3-deoxy-D-manno-octulosonate 8-phosphate phosphatase (KDO 8-P phosphatase)
MIKLIVLDVDGTMTNGDITYIENDDKILQSKSFDVKDGLAIASWIKLGYKVAIITGRTSQIVKKRADELKITHLYQGVHNKDEILASILEKEGINFSNVASIGDDLNDYKMLKKSKLSFAPNDAVDFIKQNVNIVCTKNGGFGAVRQMIEYIIKHDNIEEEFYNLWV